MGSEKALHRSEAKSNVEQLERWIESYRRGLSAAQKLSDNAANMLQNAHDQLHLALQELLRLEDEGGNSAEEPHKDETEHLGKALQEINRLMPKIEESFGTAEMPKTQNITTTH